MTTAPPSACPTRAASSTSSDGAAAHTAQQAANTTRPTAPSAPGSRRTHSRAAGTAASASTRLKVVSTHDTCPTVVLVLAQDVRQRQRDHGRVGQHHAHGQRQRDDGGLHPPAIRDDRG